MAEKPQNQAQQQYNLVVDAAFGIIAGPLGRDMVMQRLQKGKDDLPQAIGHTAANVLKSVVQGIAKKGRQVPKEVIGGAAQEIIAELVEIAILAELMPKDQAETIGKAAMQVARQTYMGKQNPAPSAGSPQPTPQAQPQGIIGARREMAGA